MNTATDNSATTPTETHQGRYGHIVLHVLVIMDANANGDHVAEDAATGVRRHLEANDIDVEEWDHSFTDNYPKWMTGETPAT